MTIIYWETETWGDGMWGGVPLYSRRKRAQTTVRYPQQEKRVRYTE